ncbi:MAG: GNAT family N-acetyltransferase [Polyangiales bacterium]
MLDVRLETPRLILRVPSAEDFDAFAAFFADPRTAQHLGGVQPRSVAWRSLATIIGAWTLRGFSMFSIIEKETGRWVGRGGPWMPDGWPGTEVGWAISADAQRRGYAKEAASAVLDWVFDELGWTDVVHCIVPENVASIATAHSLGSRLQRRGVQSPAPSDVRWDIYGQSRDAWHARRASR